MVQWSKTFVSWVKDRTLFVSVVFSWDLPAVERRFCLQRSMEFDRIVIGGPAIRAVPNYFSQYEFVTAGGDLDLAFKLHNKQATRTSIGCVRHCPHCGVDHIEGRFRLLKRFAPGNVLIDNNLTALPMNHFHRAMDHVDKYSTRDNPGDIQGVDVRFINEEHARRIKCARINVLRIALDSFSYVDQWDRALEILFAAGIPKRKIRSYALVAFDTDPGEGWKRCEHILKRGIKPLPMFYRPPDILDKNRITDNQEKMGWNDFERRRIMQWFYQHKAAVKY